MRQQWTDERLDDLSSRVADGFNRLDEDLRGLRSDVKAEFRALRSEMNSRFDEMQRTMIQFGGGIIATMIGMVGLLAASL
jgi:hypothetical protein